MDAHEFTADLSLVALDEDRSALARRATPSWTAAAGNLSALAWRLLRRRGMTRRGAFLDHSDATRMHAELAMRRMESRYFRGGPRF